MPPDTDGEFADDAAPESTPQPDDAPEYGKNNRKLPEDLVEKLDGCIKRLQQREQYDRRIEVLMDRILRFYDDGVQHVYPNWGTGVYQVGTAGGYVDLGNGQSVQCPLYMGAYNILRSRRRSLDAVLTQNPPGVDFVPDRPERSEDIEAAETAEGFRHLFDQANDIKKIQQDIARMFELSGRCVAWTRTVASRSRFGQNDDGSPRSMETAKVYGTLESKLPIVCACFEEAEYCFLFDDKSTNLLKAENDWLPTSKIANGEGALGESEWDRYARIGSKQAKKGYFLTGLALNGLTTEANYFLRPSVFYDTAFDDPYPGAVEGDEGKNGQPFTYRDKFLELFPEGAHLKYIGKTYSESWSESPDDALDVGFPTERDGLSGGALMEPMKVIQDAFNDYMNAKRENYETGWSVTYVAGDDEDYAAISDQQSKPNQFVLLKAKAPGTDIGNIVHREDPAAPPKGFDAAIEELRGPISQDITGALPALQGTSNHDVTATQQTMDRSQAMGMLGPAWANLQRMFAGIYKKAALLASKNPDHGSEIVTVGDGGKQISIKLEKLQKGKFHAHVSDSSFPETTAALRANLQDLIKLAAASPIGQTLFESPDNWEEFLDLNGNPDLKLIPAIAFKKQTRELEILLREAPSIPTPQDIAQAALQHAQQQIEAEQQAAQGGIPAPPAAPFQPPQPQPSLMPEADDYHQWESAKCQEYLSSEDCWLRQTIPQTQQGEGPDEALQRAKLGVQNVRLHKAVHDQFLQQQAMAKAQMAQVMKPPSESINFKDESPAGQQAMNAQAGIKAAAPEAQPAKQGAGASGQATV